MTGGHITPAVATIEELRARHPSWEIVFVGRKTALEGYITHSEEYRIIPGLGLKFLPITAGRLKREGGLGAVFSLMKFPVGVFQAVWYLARQQPALVVSFGGYIALPVVLASRLWRIPVVTHEQTMRPGLANRIISRLATAICVSFPEAATRFDTRANIVVTGLPVRKSVLHPPKGAPFSLDAKAPLLFIVGGSTGSTSVNDVVFKSLPILLSQYTVVHQVGRVSGGAAKRIQDMLEPSLRSRYHAMPYLSTESYSYLVNKATIVIGRSGANTVTEIAVLGKVAIFIPLPWSANQEQYHNAMILKDAGSALVLEQRNFTPESLIKDIYTVMNNLPAMRRKAKAYAAHIPQDGAQRFVKVIADTLSL